MNFLKQFHFFKRIGGINIFSRKLRRNKTIVCIFKKKKKNRVQTFTSNTIR